MTPVVIMGASGVGKSTIGALIATRLKRAFVDADILHPETNIAKMTNGIPLSEANRDPWLLRVGERIADDRLSVTACSALRRRHRNVLRSAADDIAFVHLAPSPAMTLHRLTIRTGHFMSADLLDSQLDALEPLQPDERGITVASIAHPEYIVDEII